MAYLDDNGLQSLWNQVDSIFARLTEAGASISLSGTSLVLTSAAGTQLSSIDLNGTFVTEQELQQAISGATSGTISENTANGRFGNSLSLSGNQLKLVNYNGTVISTVTLP